MLEETLEYISLIVSPSSIEIFKRRSATGGLPPPLPPPPSAPPPLRTHTLSLISLSPLLEKFPKVFKARKADKI